MLLNNLKAIRRMLEKPVSRSKTECAVILLDEVITFLETRPEQKIDSVSFPDSDLSPEANAARNELLT